MKLIQRHLLKGLREFEVVDDRVEIRLKAPFKDQERITVMLSVLNPEPVITSTSVDFTSRVNGEPLLSLYLGKPNAEEFNAFVGTLKQQALEAYHQFAGLRHTTSPAMLNGNVFDEPPEFEAEGTGEIAYSRKTLDRERIEEAISMLRTYLNHEELAPFLQVLETLAAAPNDEARQIAVVSAFNELGFLQGAVLTYAPYVGALMSDGPAGSPY